jgi:hypothetical protein
VHWSWKLLYHVEEVIDSCVERCEVVVLLLESRLVAVVLFWECEVELNVSVRLEVKVQVVVLVA